MGQRGYWERRDQGDAMGLRDITVRSRKTYISPPAKRVLSGIKRAQAISAKSKGAKPYTNLTEQLSDSFRTVTANRFLLPSAF